MRIILESIDPVSFTLLYKINLFKKLFKEALNNKKIFKYFLILINLDFYSRDNRFSFDSIVSLNFDEEKKSHFTLKSEYLGIVEILSLNSSIVEYSMKQSIFNKSIFRTFDYSNPEQLHFFMNGIIFNVNF